MLEVYLFHINLSTCFNTKKKITCQILQQKRLSVFLPYALLKGVKLPNNGNRGPIFLSKLVRLTTIVLKIQRK